MEDAVNILGMFWPFLILIAIFYFFMYRPQKKLQLERGRFLLSLRKGDHVVTSGGVHGIIKVLRDKYVELEIAPKVVIKVEKTAIHHGDVELIDAETAKNYGLVNHVVAQEELLEFAKGIASKITKNSSVAIGKKSRCSSNWCRSRKSGRN